MEKFAVTGNPIFHSLSPQIFNHFFEHFNLDAAYSRLAIEDETIIIDIYKKLGLSGLSVTAPFKNSIARSIDRKDEYSIELKASNTVSNKDSISAYNTDVLGIRKCIENHNINNINCLVLGAGGAAAAAVKAVIGKVKNVTIINRTVEKAIKLANRFNASYANLNDLQKHLNEIVLVINTIPAYSDFDFNIDMRTGSVFLDANYVNNDYSINMKAKGVEYISGLVWLFYQAKSAFKIFFDLNAEYIRFEDISINTSKPCRFALIGFMGAGKTTLGKELAKRIGYDHVDTDEEVESYFGKSINRIFDENGESEFRRIESEILSKFNAKNNLVLSCGGGIVEQPNNIDLLKSSFNSIYLFSDLNTCLERASFMGRPLLNNAPKRIEEIYNNRLDRYFKASDLIVSSENNIKMITQQLYHEIKTII